MQEVILTSSIITIAWCIFGIIIAFLLLRLRDKAIGLPFRDVFKTIAKDPLAAAIYYGLTAIAVFLYMGLAVS